MNTEFASIRLSKKRKEGTWDRATLRYLRHKFGKDKKTYLLLHSIYLALCEIWEDFGDKPIKGFTKTVGSYAGCSRHTAGKYLTVLEKENLLKKHQNRDPITKKFFGGTVVEIQDIVEYVPYQKGEEAVGRVSRQRGIQPSISTDTNITNKKSVEKYKKEISVITKWAFERSETPPNCSAEAFEKAVIRAIDRVGYDIVYRYFANETNAISFMVNIKNA